MSNDVIRRMVDDNRTCSYGQIEGDMFEAKATELITRHKAGG
jgi:hypothetical protein